MTNNVPMEMRPSPIDDYKSNGDESMSNEFEKDFQRPTNPVGWRSEAEPEKEHLLQRAFEAERLVEKLRDELNVMQDKVNLLSRTTNHSVQMTFQEDSERKLREKLELELASKEHQIATLTLDRDKLQSTLNQVNHQRQHHFFLIQLDLDLRSGKNVERTRKINWRTEM